MILIQDALQGVQILLYLPRSVLEPADRNLLVELCRIHLS